MLLICHIMNADLIYIEVSLNNQLDFLRNKQLMEIKGENPSVEKITIIKENICEEHVINNFINLSF